MSESQLEEFGPDIRDIKGKDNIVADAISRLPTAEDDQNDENCTESQGLVSKILPKMEHLILEDMMKYFHLICPFKNAPGRTKKKSIRETLS